MPSRSAPLLPSEAAPPLPLDLTGLVSHRQLAILSGLLGFLTFMPYPSFDVFNNSAIQTGNLITLLLCVPLLFVSWRGRPFYLFPLLVAPMVISSIYIIISGLNDPDLCLKSIIVRSLSGMSMLAVQQVAPAYALELMTGIAAATLLHFSMGMWQMYSFGNGEFPLPELFINSSFLSVQGNARTIAKYTQRPFGIFPEPSAMASSLAPWILFWTAHLCGFVRLKREPVRWQRFLFAFAALFGLLLILVSRSGHTSVTMLSVLLFAAVWFVKCRATPRNVMIILIVAFVVLPPLVWLGASVMEERLGGKGDVGNSSWEERSSSLVAGYKVVTEGSIPRLIFGLGPGLSSPVIHGTNRLDAVWSVVLAYVYETGVVGAAACMWLTWYLLRIWKQSQFNIAFILICFVWFIGVLLTTSYEQLLPIWVALGWLTVWQDVCLPPDKSIPARPADTVVAISRAWGEEPDAESETPPETSGPALSPWTGEKRGMLQWRRRRWSES